MTSNYFFTYFFINIWLYRAALLYTGKIIEYGFRSTLHHSQADQSLGLHFCKSKVSRSIWSIFVVTDMVWSTLPELNISYWKIIKLLTKQIRQKKEYVNEQSFYLGIVYLDGQLKYIPTWKNSYYPTYMYYFWN